MERLEKPQPKTKKRVLHASKDAHYDSYKQQDRWRTNKIRRLKRHIRKFPADKQAQKALELL